MRHLEQGIHRQALRQVRPGTIKDVVREVSSCIYNEDNTEGS